LLLQGDPVFTIGNHQLEGKVVPLAKPLAMMQKQQPPTSGNDDDDDDGNEVDGDASSNTKQPSAAASYDIVGIVRSKYLFKHRPRPVAAPTV
jgi:chromosome transmission fidelity protein 8